MPKGTVVAAREAELKKEYGSNTHAIYGTLNKMGLMRGNKPTAAGMKRRLNKARPPKATHHAMANH